MSEKKFEWANEVNVKSAPFPKPFAKRTSKSKSKAHRSPVWAPRVTGNGQLLTMQKSEAARRN